MRPQPDPRRARAGFTNARHVLHLYLRVSSEGATGIPGEGGQSDSSSMTAEEEDEAGRAGRGRGGGGGGGGTRT